MRMNSILQNYHNIFGNMLLEVLPIASSSLIIYLNGGPMLKHIIVLFALLAPSAFAIQCGDYFYLRTLKSETKTENPLLRKSRLEKGVYPEFDRIEPGHFLEALDVAKVQAQRLLNEIREEKNPTFENVILKSEEVSRVLNNANGVLDFYTGSFKTEAIEKIEELYAEETSRFYSEIGTDARLFAQVKAVYESRGERKYAPDQLLLIEDSYKGYTRGGALLNDAQKARFVEITQELSSLSVKFQNNVAAYKKANFVHVTDAKDLAGIPADIVGMMEQAAQKRGLTGAVIEMGQPSIIKEVMERADSESLRREVFFKNGKAGYSNDAFNNESVLRRIVELRQERAQLLGFETHADYVIQERMAASVSTVNQFLDTLGAAYRPKAEQERDTLVAYKEKLTGSREMQPWERSYWMVKFENEILTFDTNVFKEYLPYQNVRAGFFNLIHELYGITFKERRDLPRIDPDVEVYQVISKEGETYGYLTVDMFARDIKRGGAWMNPHSNSYELNGERVPALVSINLNTAKPVEGKSHLLTINEGETFYHEMGHALHGLLSRVRYDSQSGTNVKWDFVELPSQVMENFFKERMGQFAFHHETGKPIPKEYLAKLEEQHQLFSGIAGLRQISFAQLDMAWYTGAMQKMTGTLSEIDRAIMDKYSVFPSVDGTSMSAAFTHIFSGGYSAGYYSYKWAELLDADAYFIMRTQGVEAARRFLRYVLEVGGSLDPNQAYVNFAGRPATIDALLIRDGVKKAPSVETPSSEKKLNESKISAYLLKAIKEGNNGRPHYSVALRATSEAEGKLVADMLTTMGAKVTHITGSTLWIVRKATLDMIIEASNDARVVSISGNEPTPPPLHFP